jgi:Flp pilus assembly protein TadD
MRAILGILLLTGIALPGVSESFQGSPDTQPLRHAEAIALARNGETAKALDMLGELRRLQPDDEQLYARRIAPSATRRRAAAV